MTPMIVVSKGEKEIIYRCKPSCRGTDIPEILLKGMVLDGIQEDTAKEIDCETAHKLVKAINISYVETDDGYLVRSAEVCYNDVNGR